MLPAVCIGACVQAITQPPVLYVLKIPYYLSKFDSPQQGQMCVNSRFAELLIFFHLMLHFVVVKL